MGTTDLIEYSIQMKQSFGIAENLSKSEIIPKVLRNKPFDVMVILQTGSEMGLTPMQSLRSLYVVNGTPTMSGQTMLSLIIQRVPNAHIVIENGENEVSCTMSREKDASFSYTETWDMGRAKQAGLLGKDNWQKYPMNMLKWRAVSDCAKTVFPDIIQNTMGKEEALDMEYQEKETREVSNEYTEKRKEDKGRVDDALKKTDEIDTVVEGIDENIKSIKNHSFKIFTGQYKNIMLHEVPIEDLKLYYKKLFDAKASTGHKWDDIQKNLFEQMGYYITEYDKLE